MDKENKITQILNVDGMTCSGCENRIENALTKLNGIIEVQAKFSSSTVKVIYDKNIVSDTDIIARIEKLDYKVKNNDGVKRYTKAKSNSIDDNSKAANLKFIGVIVILIAIYFIIQNTIGFNFIPEVNQSMGYGMLFVIGLLTSLHCVAMCGGINLSQCATYEEQNYKSKFTPSLLYNLGRVISYTIIGGIFGAFGSFISISPFAKSVVSVLTGILMLIMGLNMLNVFPWLRKFNPRMPKFLVKKLKKGDSKKGPLYVGLLNGLMPCGPLQAMQIYALGTGSFLNGSISMLLFSLGTVPLMFGLGALSSMLTSKFNHKMMKVSAALVIILGVIMMNRGLSLSGVSLLPANISIGNASNAGASASNVAVIKDGYQVVKTEFVDGRYTPIVVQKGIPVKWTITIKQGEINGCNNPVTIPEYKISQKLVIGDNLIEFTPTRSGNVIYTCWMGMISSNIKVVDNLSTVSKSDAQDTSSNDSNLVASIGSTNVSVNPDVTVGVATIKNGVQQITTKLTNGIYAPIIVQKGIPVKWTIQAESRDINSCNGTMTIQEFNITKRLVTGDNVIEFTPTTSGLIGYSCWMGMVSSNIKVVDDISKVTQSDIDELKKNTSTSSGGCCSVGGASNYNSQSLYGYPENDGDSSSLGDNYTSDYSNPSNSGYPSSGGGCCGVQ